MEGGVVMTYKTKHILCKLKEIMPIWVGMLGCFGS